MAEKKISFGFSKTVKKTPLQAGPAASVSASKNDSKQFIECLEENTIKTVGTAEEPAGPLVIPLRAEDKITIPDRLAKVESVKQEKQHRLNHKQKPEATVEKTSSEIAPAPLNETLDQRAAREIVEATKQANNTANEQQNFVVPLLPEELPLDGAQESTLDDYETIPIESFGMAMLRGMGLKEDPKKVEEKGGLPDVGPVMRPKGLGLGADRSKLSKALDAQLIPAAPGEVLVMKTGAQVKVLAGKHQDRYGANGVPERIVLLDWQIARYVTPVLDLAYFIFCGTNEEFRRRHYDEMMALYYNSLATLLEKLGHNPQEVFPRTALMRQLRTFGRFGVLMAVFLVPMLCTRNEDLVDMDEAAEKYRDGEEMDIGMLTKNANQKDYAVRMRGVIKDIVRYGYL